MNIAVKARWLSHKISFADGIPFGPSNVLCFASSRAAWLFSFYFILVTHSFAQSEPASTPPAVIKVRTELVTVPVVVTDKSGAHLHGLRKEDFALLQDGKAQSIARFDEVVSSVPQVSPMQTNHFSNIIVSGQAPVPLTVLLFDLVNTPLSDQNYARTQLVKYLTASNPPKPWMVI